RPDARLWRYIPLPKHPFWLWLQKSATTVLRFCPSLILLIFVHDIFEQIRHRTAVAMTGVEFCNFMHLPRRLPAARRQIYAFEHFVIVKIIADCGGVLIINPVKLSDFTDADAFMNAFFEHFKRGNTRRHEIDVG